MSELQRLTNLALAACQHPPGSPERLRALNRLVREIQQSGKLWRDPDTEIYNEALSRTWLYFTQNLCEASTTTPFDPSRSSVTHWFNTYLKYRLRDLRNEKMNDRYRRPWSQAFFDPDNPTDPTANLAAPEDIPPMLDITYAWLDAGTEPRLQNIHVKGRSDITAEILIRKRLPPEASWKEIGEELDYPSQLLSAFYHRHCLPLLREFGREQGFLTD
ncbi:MAG: sigma-70 family RNA polymerase sigma factor [Coleofasciculaceae cyanobacterium RL_1_1]|nr:sigma-70 family RNA polymerase sigma factor [Coleofasciculaceae cyanobacterium RL_1_1]